MRTHQKPDFSKRSAELEIMDDLNCDGAVVDRTLKELEVINRLLGGNRVTLSAVRQIIKRHASNGNGPISIADLGCGGGDMLKRIADFGTRNKIPMKLTGIDANPHIIEFARQNCLDYPQIAFEAIDVLAPGFQQRSYDILLGTLFFHHFPDSTLVGLLSQIKRQARLGIAINDIHRHWLAYYSIQVLTRLFSRSAMVRFDAPLSVLRAFTRHELNGLLARSGIRNYTIHWKWAFRWKILIYGP